MIQIFPDQNVQRHSETSLDTAHSLPNGPSWGWGGGVVVSEGEVCILRPPGMQRLLPLFCLWEDSVGGDYGRGNFLHWKANMLPLFSIMTLCWQQWGFYSIQ